MDKCKNCKKPLTHVEGRKKKQFCDGRCKQKHFYAEQRALVKKAKEYEEKEAGTPPPPKVIVKNLTKGTNTTKPVTDPPDKSNMVIDTTKKHPLWKEGDPKENTPSFYMKYEVMDYEALKEKLKNK